MNRERVKGGIGMNRKKGGGRTIFRSGIACLFGICLILSALTGCAGGGGSRESGSLPAQAGGGEETVESSAAGEGASQEIYEVQVEQKEFSLPDHLLGVQFDGERAVAFYSLLDADSGQYDGCLYEYDIDLDTFQPVLEDIPQELLHDAANWYRSSDGTYYVYETDSFVCLNGEGEELTHRKADGVLVQITETKNGETVLYYNDTRVEKYDPRTHRTESKGKLGEAKGAGLLAPGYEKSLLVLETWEGICELDLSTLERTYSLHWDEAPYAMEGEPLALRQISARSCEILLYLREDGSYRRDILSTEPIRGDGRIVLTCRTPAYVLPSLRRLAAGFNQSQTEYFLTIESMGEGEDYSDYVQRTAVEIAAGRGPDLVDEGVLSSPLAMIRQGALEELTPYLEKSGMQWSDLYPAAYESFSYEGGVYGMAYEQYPILIYVKSAAAEAVDEKNIQGFLKLLERKPGKGETFCEDYYTPRIVLHRLLAYSEDLQGLVDWEENRCNFQNPLWYQLLEAAGHWGAREGVSYSRRLIRVCYGYDLKSYTAEDGEFRSEGMVPLGGFPTKNDMTVTASVSMIGINALSAHKEGAWKFLEYCLGDEGQSKTDYFPADRKASKRLLDEAREEALEKSRAAEELAEEYREQGLFEPEQQPDVFRDGKGYIITQERIGEIEDMLEECRSMPLRNQTVMDIVLEESGAYWSGDKTAQEVTDIIENRVQLYLDENS